MSAHYTIEPATAMDEPALRALLRDNPMGRRLRVAFAREPDFFAAASVQGEEVQVGLAREQRSGRIVGLGTRALGRGFLNGQSAPLGYLGDLRLVEQARRGTLLARAYRQLRLWHQDGRAPLYTTVIFADNAPALAALGSGRAGLPAYHDCGAVLCPGIRLKKPMPALEAGCTIHRGTPQCLPDIVACLNRNHARRQFAPEHRLEHFAPGGRWRDLQPADFFVARRSGAVIGVLGRWDQRGFKQTRIMGYGGALRWLAATPLRSRFGLPPAGGTLASVHACFPAVDGDELPVFRALLRALYNSCLGQGLAFCTIGLHERDPLVAALEDYPLIPFTARLFCVSFEDGEPLFRSLDGRVPHVEPALL